MMPRWVDGSSHAFIHLGAGVVIAASLVFMGYVIERYDHATTAQTATPRVPLDGVWFCVAGRFGNGCWDWGVRLYG